jgi:DNA-directed RNA polymerase subunit beta
MSNMGIDTQVIRKAFGKIKDVVSVPNLIEVQSSSFNDFVQLDYLAEDRKNIGLQKVLRDLFPIEYEDKLSLDYVSYELGFWACICGQVTGIENRYAWSCSSCKKSGCSFLVDGIVCPLCSKKSARYKSCGNCLSRVQIQMPMTLDDCRTSGQTFSMPLKIKIQLINWTKDDAGNKTVRDIKEQDIFFADLPVMSDIYEKDGRYRLGSLGTFLINGVDRVVVSQLHRSPGVVFSQSKKIKDYRGKPYFLARLIPQRGSWIDFEFDSNDILYVRIDKKKKILLTTFLQALGFERNNILSLFYQSEKINCNRGLFSTKLDEHVLGTRLEKDALSGALDKKYAGQRITRDLLKTLQEAGVEKLIHSAASLFGRVASHDVLHPVTGEILIAQGDVVTEESIALLSTFDDIVIDLVKSSGYVFRPTVAATLLQDKCFSEEDALKEVHIKLWPGDSASLKEIRERFFDLIFNERLYDLTKVGRIRINRKLGLKIPENVTILTKDDIIGTTRYLVNLRELGEGELDDIDHLGNRRVRLVGELLNNQMWLGFTRIERIIRERCRMQEVHSALMPQDFLNVKPLGAVIREFFGLGQLSQFMDQTNPLSEIAHKRRLSALGPGGVMKDRATFEVRDVHTSHYGRICPIETPEGQTVGLISSLATYAVVNDLGFIETAYRPVEKGKIKDEVVFLDAFDESPYYIAQADSLKAGVLAFASDVVLARHEGNFVHMDAKKIDYVDLSPKQLVSVSTALIPFLEHDDAVRALMGANMQRQAVPLIRTETPIVATGMEKEIARASGALIVARRAGIVEYVSADKILVRVAEADAVNTEDWFAHGIDTYSLRKFQRSSYSTWVHQQPVVQRGDSVKAGDVLSNAQSINQGELALGANLLVAFMPWHGYNFEDAIILNQRLVYDDVFTSIHIDEYAADARDTKLGPEEITRDIPNVSESMLKSLDEDGIVRIGTRVKPGDILVGKVTLKGDVQYSPEEKLLRAIFGEKSREVRDTSLRVPPGINGTIIDVKIFSRGGMRKDKRYKKEVMQQIAKFERDFVHHVELLQNMLKKKIAEIVHGQTPMALSDSVGLVAGLFDTTSVSALSVDDILSIKVKDKKINDQVKECKAAYENQVRILTGIKEERANKLRKGDFLQSGVIKVVKVYIAMKRLVSVGDKVAGRHGNKGVVSTIVRREDMPYMADGTPVDIILNPIGLPSRMNLGQILETVLGLAGYKLGERLKGLLEAKREAAVEDYLISYYGKEIIESYKKHNGVAGLIEFAQHTAKTGIKFKTPVFDSADLGKDILPLMTDLGLPETCSFKLRDGRSDEYFDQPVTVGYIYMLKLNHMVDDKLHARSVGPYSLVTQQPLGGKAQQGGQRLGEMEVWALEAYGAAYTLQEMLTIKSDDVTGRHKAYQSIVRGEDVSEPGVPESFNVLIKELQSLGLQVDLLKIGKENIGE